MSVLRYVFPLVIVAALGVVLVGQPQSPARADETASMGAPVAAPAANSLYKRLGGYDAIAAVTDDFIKRLATDKQLSRFFVGLSDESKAHVRQMVVDLICAKTGGPCYYLGRDMKTAHAGLHITDDDWNRSIDAFKLTLAKFHVGAKEQDDLFAIISPLKSQIVTGK